MNWEMLIVAVVLAIVSGVLVPLAKKYINNKIILDLMDSAVAGAEQWKKNQLKLNPLDHVSSSNDLMKEKATDIFNSIGGDKFKLDADTVSMLIETAVGKLNKK